MVAKKNNILRDEKGQALFELIIFLPLMIFLLTIIFTVGNSINASINQEKAARRYFYYLAKGNARLPDSADLKGAFSSNVQVISMSSVAWREKQDSAGGAKDKSFASCYKINTLFTNDSDDECDKPSVDEKKTQFIRIYTAYGICGEDYVMDTAVRTYYRNAENPQTCGIQK